MANVFTRTADGGGWEISNTQGNGKVIIDSNGNINLTCTSLKSNDDTVALQKYLDKTN